MLHSRPLLPALALCGAILLAACGSPAGPAAKEQSAAAPSIDEAKLPPVLHFAAADLDPALDPCTDFTGYVNAKWLASNPIPADRTSWGPGAMLVERSLGVRRQLAEHAAAMTNAAGVDKILGDFWATGMDEAAVNAQGIRPLASRLAEVEGLTDAGSIAAYLRTTAARGEPQVFGFGPEADFKNSTMMIAFATQSGLGLPDRGYYFDADKS
ncbi:MAG: peptidase, partial [Thermoanaerobaculia bacterium]